MKTWYIVDGEVTNMEAHDYRASIGGPEWRFCDHPYRPGMFHDFLTLEEGLRKLSPAVFIWSAHMPPLSPLEADAAIRTEGRDPLIIGDWTFTLDGPMGISHGYLVPVATHGKDKAAEEWFCSGETGDRIDASTYWVMYDPL